MNSRVYYQKKVEGSPEIIKQLIEELLAAAQKYNEDGKDWRDTDKPWEETLFALEMCARELITNAVKHGQRKYSLQDIGSKSCTVEVKLTIVEKSLILTVEDSGCGFDWQKTVPVKAEQLAESGRGLAIVAALAEELKFNREGNRVTVKLGCGR